MRTIWLKARCRIGIEDFSAVYPKSVTSADASIDSARKISAWFRCQRMKRSLQARAMFEDNIKLSCFRGPEAKMGLVFANHFRADRVATLYTRHREQTWRSSSTKQPRSWGCRMRCRQRICHDRCSRFPVGSVTLGVLKRARRASHRDAATTILLPSNERLEMRA